MNTETTKVLMVDTYGSDVVWFRIETANGDVVLFTIDRRNQSETRNRLFRGARHPENKNAELVPLGCEDEGSAISSLSRWIDSGTPRELGFTEYGWKIVRAAIDEYGM